ncbi:GrpB family protein [Acidithiobacillus thiooxidans]|uniref:GrpB family protein n=1 Tax=Acidithiobacillus thiooxidans ATCC 19377 TaxID=637390 RepID=A0A543Q2W1_ACITH|nr:GrpB family protein [Acidithiobacillus thiooxidans]MDX5935188.1 GrpB family protein [Acidithiobacillus thiooxidans]TQN50676.1 hypothetical protein DLNHIDIE_00531 [Acidithiobacillus thiooxidans ATCC 19377]
MKLLEPSCYQSLASAAYESVVDELSPLLTDARFEHIGASAIPGAISKGDLDICIVVDALKHRDTVEALEALGYVVKTGTLRTPELCMLVSPRRDLDIALQIVAAGSEFEFFMHFRDALLANACLVHQYNEIKRKFASFSPDCYRNEKAKFILSVLERGQ